LGLTSFIFSSFDRGELAYIHVKRDQLMLNITATWLPGSQGQLESSAGITPIASETSTPTLLEDGYDICTVQQLSGHKDVKTTMIYTHVLNRGGKGVRSPLD
jgi:hypothetical protein